MSSWMSSQPHWFNDSFIDSHWGQRKGFSPVLILKCISNVSSRANDYAHSGQLWGFLPMWTFKCSCNFYDLSKTVRKFKKWFLSQQCALSNGTRSHFNYLLKKSILSTENSHKVSLMFRDVFIYDRTGRLKQQITFCRGNSCKTLRDRRFHASFEFSTSPKIIFI